MKDVIYKTLVYCIFVQFICIENMVEIAIGVLTSAHTLKYVQEKYQLLARLTPICGDICRLLNTVIYSISKL